MPIIRNWHPTTLTAPSQRLIHTFPRSAKCAIFAARITCPQSFLTGRIDAPRPAALGNYQPRMLLLISWQLAAAKPLCPPR